MMSVLLPILVGILGTAFFCGCFIFGIWLNIKWYWWREDRRTSRLEASWRARDSVSLDDQP